MKRMQRVLVVGVAILVIALITAGAVLASPPRQGPVVSQPASGGGTSGGDNQAGQQPKRPAPPSVSLPDGMTIPGGQQPAVAPQAAGADNQAGTEGAAPQVIPAGQMSYQGKLLQDGNPYNGNIAITFRLYDAEAGGVLQWEETQTVNVQNGLFNVMLGAATPIEAVDFQRQLWLGIQPAGAAAELSPRQLLGATAYAESVLPGATMVDTSDGSYNSSFWVHSWNHNGIYASSDITDGYGLRGIANGSGGTGLYGEGSLYGVSGYGPYGVYGASDAFFGVGVYGQNPDAGWGVMGYGVVGVFGYTSGEGGTGVFGSGGYTSTVGVYGSNNGYDSYGVEGVNSGNAASCYEGSSKCAAGVYAEASADAYGLWAYSSARSAGVLIPNTNLFYGLWVYSLQAPNGGIYANGDSSFDGYVTFSGGKSGYVVDIARNSGGEPLERGDVVVITGYSDPVVGQVPVIEVAKATSANATGVVGVVDVLYSPCDRPAESLQAGEQCGGWQHDVTTIQPGQYLGVVTLGSYGWIKADASSGPIHAGDLLATSATTGYATKAPVLTVSGVSFVAPGTVVGKAMGDLDSGTGMIPVFVSAR